MSTTTLSTKRSYVELHIAVLLWGFTAILGKWINLPAIDLVWWRVLLTSFSLLYFVKWGKKLLSLPRKQLLIYAGIGVLVGTHWICFYGSIKLANASVSLICMATTSLFAALLEPLFLKSNFKWLDLGLSLIIIPAMALVAQTLEQGMQLGILVGLASAFLAAMFSVLNKKYVSKADPYTITYVELTSAWVFISILLVLFDFGREERLLFPPSSMDWVWMVVLALVCTTLTFILSLRALTGLSAFASTLVVNLEPVYGILLAVLLLGEHQEMSGTFYIGCGIILLVVLSYPFLKPRRS